MHGMRTLMGSGRGLKHGRRVEAGLSERLIYFSAPASVQFGRLSTASQPAEVARMRAACRPRPARGGSAQLSPTTTAVMSSCMGPLRRQRSRAICAILSEAACGVLALAAMATASDDETWSHTPSEPKMSTW